MNETLWIAFLTLDLCLVLVVYNFFGRVGLFGLVVFNLILCNIQVLKFIDLFGFTTTLGNVLYASVFLSTDILSEKYGKAEARRAVFLGFGILLMATAYMQIALQFTPSSADFAQESLETIFGFFPRVVFGSLAAYFISQMHDIWAFHFWKEKTKGKYLWLRNNLSTLSSQLLDTLIFCFIAFWADPNIPMPIFWEIVFTTYIFKFAVAIADTPFLYLAKKIRPRA